MIKISPLILQVSVDNFRKVKFQTLINLINVPVTNPNQLT
jgi:hypothetical protein